MGYEVDLKVDVYMRSHTSSKKAEEKIKKTISRALGHAGKILDKYHYITVTKSHSSRQHSGWIEEMDGGIIYSSGYYIPKDIQLLISKYCADIEALHRICEEIMALDESLKKQEAFDLWEQA